MAYLHHGGFITHIHSGRYPHSSCRCAREARAVIAVFGRGVLCRYLAGPWRLFAGGCRGDRGGSYAAGTTGCIVAFIWVCNAFAFDVGSHAESGLGGVSAGFAEGWQPVALVGTFGFVPQGCMFALFYAVRILLILWASFAVSFTTSVEALTGAFASLMRPLRAIRVPVDDVATMLSLAVRFIPLTAEELALVRSAQTARGARLESGSIWQRLFAYRTVFIPLVVRLFRRADTLSVSMVARCYGCTQRTSLEEPLVCLRQAVVFLACSALLVVVACIL